MKTIVEPKERIAKLWGKPKVDAKAAYRLMKYVLQVTHNGKAALHNVVTGHLVLLEANDLEIMNRLPVVFTDEIRELVESHFLVPEAYDEHQTVIKLKKLLRMTETDHSITGYTILPTTNCNARCFYCYEANVEHVNMSEETADKIIRFICDHCGNKKRVSIGWFGGEPTLGWKRIDQICNGLAANGVEYSASMISNGYLFDPEMVRKARELWKLNMIQITLDGTEEVYNRVKSYVSSDGSAYRRVLRNIDLLLERNISVSVRMNLDRHNHENLRLLIAELRERFAGRKGFSAYVWPLFDNCGFVSVQHTEEDRKWLIRQQNELNAVLRSAGMYRERENDLPSINAHYCMADNSQSLLINANGDFAKCEHVFATDTVGNIHEGITDTKRIAEWRETVEYPECADCCLFPNCHTLKNCFSTGVCAKESLIKRFTDIARLKIEAL